MIWNIIHVFVSSALMIIDSCINAPLYKKNPSFKVYICKYFVLLIIYLFIYSSAFVLVVHTYLSSGFSQVPCGSGKTSYMCTRLSNSDK